MKFLLKAKALVIVALIGGLFSCQKNAEGPDFSSNVSYHSVVKSSVSPSDDNFLFDRQGSTYIDLIKELGIEGRSVNEADRGCVKKTDSGPGYPREIIYDFDSCSNSSGQIIITISDSLQNPGAEYIKKYVNLVKCGKTINGFRRFKNLGLNKDGNPEFESESDFECTNKDGETSSYKRYEHVEWIKGFDTEERDDDEFLINGSEEKVKKDGTTKTKKITKPIHITRECKYPISGTIELMGGKKDGTLDYGDGECDKIGTFTDTNGVEEEVELRKWWRFW